MASDPWTELLQKPITRGAGSWMHRGPTVNKPRGTSEGDRQRLLSEAYREFYVRTHGAIAFKSVDELETWLQEASHGTVQVPANETYYQHQATLRFAALVPQLLKSRNTTASSVQRTRVSVDRQPQSYRLYSGENYPAVSDSAQPATGDSLYRGLVREGSQQEQQANDNSLGQKRKRGEDVSHDTSRSKRRSGDSAFASRVSELTSSMRKASEHLVNADQDNKQWSTIRRLGDGALQRSLAQREQIRKELEEQQRERLALEVQKEKTVEALKAQLKDDVRRQLQEELREPVSREVRERLLTEARTGQGALWSDLRAELYRDLRQEMSELLRSEAQQEIRKQMELEGRTFAQTQTPNGPVKERRKHAEDSPIQEEASDSAFGSKRTSADSSPGSLKRKRSDNDEEEDVTGSGEEGVKRKRMSPRASPTPASFEGVRLPAPTDIDRDRAGDVAETSALKPGFKTGSNKRHLPSREDGDDMKQGEPSGAVPDDANFFEAEQARPSERTVPADCHAQDITKDATDRRGQGEEQPIDAVDTGADGESLGAVISESQTIVAESQVTLENASEGINLAEAFNARYPDLQLTAGLASALTTAQSLKEDHLGMQRPEEDESEGSEEEDGDMLDEEGEGGEEDESQMDGYDDDDGLGGFEDAEAEYEGAEGYEKYVDFKGSDDLDEGPYGYNDVGYSNGGVIQPSASQEVIDLCDSDDDDAKEAAGAAGALRAEQAAEGADYDLEESADDENLESEGNSTSTSLEDEEDDEDEDEDQPMEAGTPEGEPPQGLLDHLEQVPTDAALLESQHDSEHEILDIKQESSPVLSHITPNISFEAAEPMHLNDDSGTGSGAQARDVAGEQNAEMRGDDDAALQAKSGSTSTSSANYHSQEIVAEHVHEEASASNEVDGSDGPQEEQTEQIEKAVSLEVLESTAVEHEEQVGVHESNSEDSDGEFDDVQSGNRDEEGSADRNAQSREHEVSDEPQSEQPLSPEKDGITETNLGDLPDPNDVDAGHEGDGMADGQQVAPVLDEPESSTRQAQHLSSSDVSDISQAEIKPAAADTEAVEQEEDAILPDGQEEPASQQEGPSAPVGNSTEGPPAEDPVLDEEYHSEPPTEAKDEVHEKANDDSAPRKEEYDQALANEGDGEVTAVDVTKLGSSFRKPATGPSNEELSRSLHEGSVSILGGGSSGVGNNDGSGDGNGDGNGGGADGLEEAQHEVKQEMSGCNSI